MNDGSCWSRVSRGSARRRCRPRSRGRRSRTARSCCTGAATRISGSRISRGPRYSPISSAHAPDDVLAAHVDARGSELARLAPDLAARATAGRVSSSDAESERYLLFGCGRRPAGRVSALAPVVLVLDDLHWADRPTVQLLRHVVSADAPLRLLVIGTFRDSDVGHDHPLAEALAALHRESGVERLALARPRRRRAPHPARDDAPGTRWPRTVWPCATRCRPRRTAIRSSSVRCSGTWPRPGPSTRTSTAGGSRARTCGRRACRSASAR